MENKRRIEGHNGALSNPTDIARETLHRLAARRIKPTPDNYRELYHEIAGFENCDTDHDANSRLCILIQSLVDKHDNNVKLALQHALDEKTWPATRAALIVLAELRAASRLGARSAEIHRGPVPAAEFAAVAPDPHASHFRHILGHLLESHLAAGDGYSDDIVAKGRSLAVRVRDLSDTAASAELAAELRQFCAKLELCATDNSELRRGLLRLLRLLVDNIGELIVDDTWVSGQIAVVREIMSQAASVNMINDAERFLKEVILRQGVIKHSIRQAQSTLKTMVSKFIDHLGDLSEGTGSYHAKLEGYSRRIEATNKIDDLNQVLDDLMRDTREMQATTERSRAEISLARDRAETAERKIRTLESDLARVSEKVREDQLTGTLNRHGLDEAFAREAARAHRHEVPLSLALLDLDDFKQLNDTYGHRTGDNALLHLVKVMRETVRPNDIICRYGGEEFLILLPDTALEDAIQVIARLQRQLTRGFFLHDNKRMLITFSAGVALWNAGEAQEAVIARADEALYEAKKAGKNRTLAAK